MITPRTRRTTTILEPSEDTTHSKVVIPDGTKATIREQIGAKEVVYEAEIKEDETRNQDNTNGFDNDENDFDIDENAFAPPLPKTPLDLLFDEIQFAVDTGSQDHFFAKLLRQPDSISDRFNIPCREMIELGIVQFCTRDRFNLVPEIQKINNNSGGRFAVSIHNADYSTLKIARGRSIHAIEREVGAVLVIPNPIVHNETANGNNGNGGFDSVFNKMIEMQQQNHAQLIQILNRPREQNQMEATIMNAVMTKVANDIINPNANERKSGFDPNEFTQNLLTQGTVIAGLGEAFNKMIFREPPPEKESDWIDKAQKIADLPIAQQLAGRIMDIGDALAVKGLNLNADGTTIENPQPQPQPQPQPINGQQPVPETMTETQELITEIIEELDSDTSLNADNETIKELAADFPDQYAELVVFCKNATFEFVFERLTKELAKMQPSPLFPYLDQTETQVQQKFVYNDTGIRLQGRLRELYEYLKTT